MSDIKTILETLTRLSEAVDNPYTGADAVKFARMSDEDQEWLTRGGGVPDINDDIILRRSPNGGELIRPLNDPAVQAVRTAQSGGAGDNADAQRAATATTQQANDAIPTEDPAPVATSAATSAAERTPLEVWATENPRGGLMRARGQEDVVRDLQGFLTNSLGIDTGGVDGKYGQKTYNAVMRFQRAVTGLSADGNAGAATIGKIAELKRDVAEMRRLLSNVGESALPVRFTSSIGKLLEALSAPEKQQLQQLVNKYNNFRREFPEFEKDLFVAAAQVPEITVTYLDDQGNDTGVEVRSGDRNTDTMVQQASAAIDRAEPTGAFDPAVPAREIYVAVDGPGTDEEGIQSGLQKIANRSQWDLADRAAQSAYGESIMDLINGDMRIEAGRVQYVYPELRRIGVPHTVEVSRLMQLANVNYEEDIAPYYDAQGRFPPQGGTISAASATAPTASTAPTARPAAAPAAPPVAPGVNPALVRDSVEYDLQFIKDKLGRML